MNTDYLPNDIKQEISSYNDTHPHWVGLKYFQMATCAVALLGAFFVNEEHRDKVLGLSAVAGLTAYGIHRREENKKRFIKNEINYFNHFQKMTWQEKEAYFFANKDKERKEKEGLKMMGTGLACFIIGQPVLGGVLTVGGLLHSSTSRDFIKIQERILDKYTPCPWETQKER